MNSFYTNALDRTGPKIPKLGYGALKAFVTHVWKGGLDTMARVGA